MFLLAYLNLILESQTFRQAGHTEIYSTLRDPAQIKHYNKNSLSLLY